MSGESIVFDRVADSYDETRGGLPRGRVVAGALIRMLPPSGPVLEVGVGTGLVAAGLAELGRAPVGVDLSVPMLARARSRVPGRLAVGDAQRLPVATGAVAAAYLVHVLHLVGDIPRTLAEVVRVLRPGGTAVATAYGHGPLTDDLHREADRLRSELDAQARPDEETLVLELGRAAGLELVDRHDLPGTASTPRVLADRLEARSLSWMWPVDDELWSRLVPAALARIRALPDQDRVRPGPGPTLLAFRRA